MVGVGAPLRALKGSTEERPNVAHNLVTFLKFYLPRGDALGPLRDRFAPKFECDGLDFGALEYPDMKAPSEHCSVRRLGVLGILESLEKENWLGEVHSNAYTVTGSDRSLVVQVN